MSKEGSFAKIHNIFCIDKLNAIELLGLDEDVKSLKIINAIANQKIEFREQTIKDGIELLGFSIKLYFCGDTNDNSKLSKFCKSFVASEEEILLFKPQMASSVLFLLSDKNIFAVTTGQGFRMIEKYCVHKFGLKILSAFYDLIKISALDTNDMASIVHSSKTIYSNEVNFVDIDRLDTIFKEVTGRLSDKESVKSLLSLNTKSKKKTVKIMAKNFIQFSSSLTFAKLLNLLKIIDVYEVADLSDKFNLILPLDNKKNKAQIEKNNNAVVEKIYEYLCGNDQEFHFDMFNKDVTSFILADEYVIEAGKHIGKNENNLPELLKCSYKVFLGKNLNTKERVKEYLLKAELIAYLNDVKICSGNILENLSGEVVVASENYYMFYGKYYFLDDNYNDRLNLALQQKLNDNLYINVLQTKWLSKYNEDDYNEYAAVNDNCILIHKCIPENIEFADLLKFDGDNCHIIHVKDGFGCSMRELERQVDLSIIKRDDLVKNNKEEYFFELYNRSKNMQVRNSDKELYKQFSSGEEFVTKLKTIKKFSFVIVIRMKNNKDFLQSKSNIAKYCLNSLIVTCFNKGVELKIQIV